MTGQDKKEESGDGINVDINTITTCPQDRTDWDSDKLKEHIKGLAKNIKSNEKGSKIGLIYPIIVKPLNNGKHEIIDGECRYRACVINQYSTINISIDRSNDEIKTSFIQLSGNMQRKGLNKIDEAKALQSRMDKFNMTALEVSEKLGVDIRRINRSLQYLKLPKILQSLVYDGLIEDINTLSKAAKKSDSILEIDVDLFRNGRIMSTALGENIASKTEEINAPETVENSEKKDKRISISIEVAASLCKRLLRNNYDINNPDDVKKIVTYFKNMEEKNSKKSYY